MAIPDIFENLICYIFFDNRITLFFSSVILASTLRKVENKRKELLTNIMIREKQHCFFVTIPDIIVLVRNDPCTVILNFSPRSGTGRHNTDDGQGGGGRMVVA